MKNLINCKGLSLVEVVVATLILSTVVAAFFLIYGQANDIISMAYNRAAALYWAQAEVERLKIHVVGGPTSSDFFDEHPGGGVYAFAITGGAELDITGNPGARISHAINGANPPARVAYYNNNYNALTIHKGGQIFQRVDANQRSTGRGFRQSSVRIAWVE